MKAISLRAGALLLAASLAGCTTTWGDDGGSRRYGTEATRFHLGDPIARGRSRSRPSTPANSATPEFRTYADLVARDLTRLGWTVVEQCRRLRAGRDRQRRSSKPAPTCGAPLG